MSPARRQPLDFIRGFASAFIFTKVLAPAIAAGALASVRQLRASHMERRHQERVATQKRRLRQASVPVIPSDSHILPVPVGDPNQCREIANRPMDRYDIYMQPINYPTVTRGAERLRLTPNPFHTNQ